MSNEWYGKYTNTARDNNLAAAQPIPVSWEPNPGSQMLFLSCPFDELLFHGTRGPGKTAALLMDFLQDVGAGWGPAWRGILFRETYKQLADIVAKTYEFFNRVFPDARFSESDYTWKFPEGETLLLRYMKAPRDYWEYHGHEYPWIGWEELTNWLTSDCYDSMFSCNRSTEPGIPKRVRSTCNPWGVGHNWVKKYFIDVAPPGKPIVQEFTNPITGDTVRRVRGHIFGSIFENKHLIRNDPEYLAKLISIQDENKRKAWLEGRWDIVPGGFFGDVFLRERNVLPAFTPPPAWECFLAFDWGSASPFSLGFYAIADGEAQPVPHRVLPRGALVRFDEWYGADERTGDGLRLVNDVLGDRIVRRVHNWMGKGLRFSTGVADPSIWIEEGGPSIYEQMKKGIDVAKRKLDINPEWLGTLFEPADNARLPGWQQMRERLYNVDEDRSMLYVTDNCTEWLRTVPMLPRDENNWDDVDTDAEDHAGDESRYACMRVSRRLRIVKLGGL